MRNISIWIFGALRVCLISATTLISQGGAVSAEVRVLYSVTAPVVELEGLPPDLGTAEVATLLGVPVVVRGGPGPPVPGVQRRLSILGEVLPDLDMAELTVRPERAQLRVWIALGVSRLVVQAAPEAGFGRDDIFEISPAADAPPEGVRRFNSVTGVPEVMRGGLFLPEIKKPVAAVACRRRVRLSFLPRQRQLDLLGEHAFRNLAALAVACDARLSLVSGGAALDWARREHMRSRLFWLGLHSSVQERATGPPGIVVLIDAP